MKWLESPAAVLAGCGLIVIANLAALGAAMENRRGEPDGVLRLTERELALPWARQEEDSGLLLRILMAHDDPVAVRNTARWRQYELPRVDYPWLDRAKLRELGFRVDLDPSDSGAEDFYNHGMARRAYVVLEYEGPAWSRWLAGREESVAAMRREVEQGKAGADALADAEAVLALDRTMRSRLFPVDAGFDPVLLRRRYPDRERYAVLGAWFRARIVRPDDGPPRLAGQVSGLVTREVNVTRDLRPVFEPLLPHETMAEFFRRVQAEARKGWPSPLPPRYEARLAIGRRHEPWLAGAAPLGAREEVSFDSTDEGSRKPR